MSEIQSCLFLLIGNDLYLSFGPRVSGFTMMCSSMLLITNIITNSECQELMHGPDRISIKLLCDDLSPSGQVPNAAGLIQKMNHMMHF